MATVTDNTVQVESRSDHEEASPVNETEAAASTEEAVHTTGIVANDAVQTESKDVPNIDAGFLYKRGPRPLRLWKHRYFAFHSDPIPLTQLRLVSKKYTKAISTSKEEFEKVNRSLFHNIASATVSAEGLLFYYKSNDPDHVEVPLGIVNLGDVESVAPVKTSKPHSFSIKTTAREYILAASTADEAKAWVQKIQGKLDSIPTSTSPAETQQYKETYEALVSRQAFNPKTTPPLPTGILSDTEVLSGSDNENEQRTGEPQAVEVPKEETQDPHHDGSTEEAAAVIEIASDVHSDSPKRKSMFGNFKSFINKKTDKPTDAISSQSPEADAENAPETHQEAHETSVPEVSEEQASTQVTDAKKDEHPSRPLSFHIPKFFKAPKKEDKHEVAEIRTPEDQHAEDVAAPEVVDEAHTGAATETEVAETPESTAENPTAEPARPSSPFKRTLSNFLNLKKNKQAENLNDSTDIEVRPPVSENDNLEKPLDIVDNTAVEAVPPAPSEPVAEPVSEEAVSADEVSEKPKKPTLFKRLSLMVRSNTASKGPTQATGETNPQVSAQLTEEPNLEIPKEQSGTEAAVKAN